GYLERPGFQLISGKDLIHQSNCQSGLGVDDLSGEDHFHCLSFTYQSGQTLSTATARNYSQIDLRLPERSFVAGNANVAGQRYFATTSQTVAIDHCDNWFGKRVDRIKERTFQHHLSLGNGGSFGKFRNIGSRYESFVTGAGEHNHADRIIGTELIENRRPFRASLDVQSI